MNTSALCTVTVKLHVPLLPTESVAVQTTVVVPSGKVLPDGGEQLTSAIVHDLILVTMGSG
jgi:hypothetical protein